MKLFDKLDNNIDYNNSYTLRRAVSILESEFKLSEKSNDIQYAREILDTTQKIYDKLSETYRESEDYGETMSYMQRLWAKKLREFISYLHKCLKDNFIGKINA